MDNGETTATLVCSLSTGSLWRHHHEPDRIATVEEYDAVLGAVRFRDHVNGRDFKSSYAVHDFLRAYQRVSK